MKETFKLIFVLTVICLIAGVMLAWVNGLTAEPIRKAAEAEKMAALKTVLPACDNKPNEETLLIQDGEQQWTFYIARQGDAFTGAAFESTSAQGYGGEIRLMVGVTAQGAIHAIEVLSQKETPGLGAKIALPAFKDLFRGLNVASTRWMVKKDGGDVDQITAATISSRAVVDAISRGVKVYQANETAIRSAVR